MPERLTGFGVEGDEVLAAVAAEHQASGSRHQALRAATGVEPFHRSRFVVDRANAAAASATASCAHKAIAFGAFIGIGEIVHAERFGSAHIEEAGLRAVAGRLPVGGRTGTDQHAIDRRILLRIRNRLALRIDALRPGHVFGIDERLRQQILPADPVEHEEIAVARALHEHLARLAVPGAVEEHRDLCAVPIVRIVRRALEVPDHFSGVGVERDHRAGEEIIALAALPGSNRIRIAGGDIDQVEFGIVGGRLPGHAATVGAGVVVGPGVVARVTGLLRRGVPLPLQLAGFRIARFEEALYIEIVAAGADDDVVADDERRGGGEVAALHVGDLFVPALFAGGGVERDHEVIGGFHEQPVAVHTETALAIVMAALGLPEVVPDLPAGARIERPCVIRHGGVEDAVHQQCGALEGRVATVEIDRIAILVFPANVGTGDSEVSLVGPRECQLVDVGFADLIESAVAAAGVIAVISGPGIGRRMQEHLRVDTLRGDAGREGHE